MEQRVRIEKKDGIADVRLARPEKLNAFDLPMFAALVDAGLELASDPSLRAVVLSGEGRAFSAGLDVASFLGGGTGSGRDLFARSAASPANFAQRAAWVWPVMTAPAPNFSASRWASTISPSSGSRRKRRSPECVRVPVLIGTAPRVVERARTPRATSRA